MTQFNILLNSVYYEVEVQIKYKELIIRKQLSLVNGNSEYNLQKIKCMFLTLNTSEERGKFNLSDYLSNQIKTALNLKTKDNIKNRKARNIKL